MRLVIHGGLHKTASTSFQRFCDSNRGILREHGILYPRTEPGAFHHNAIAHRLQFPDDQAAQRMVEKFLEEADKAYETVLISAEDFEFCLGNQGAAQKMEAVAAALGFTSIEWHFVLRNRWDYLASQYAELSKQGVAINFTAMAEQILMRRSFAHVSPQLFRYYEFSYETAFPDFQGKVSGALVLHGFQSFSKNGIGRPLFESINGAGLSAALEHSWGSNAAETPQNSRRSWAAVEYRYICSFLDLDHKRSKLLKLGLLAPLIWGREQSRRRGEKRLQVEFRAMFPEADIASIQQECARRANDGPAQDVADGPI